MTKLIDQDRAILRALQHDCSLSLAKMSERVGLASSTVWCKVQESEAAGLIRARVALLDPRQVDARLAVLASISLNNHSEAALAQFAQLVARCPEILECDAVSGDADYVLRIRVPDVEACERFMTHNLLRNPHARSVRSSFVLKEIKSTTALPI
jgi:Lrp/AsnC family transcriptional regulator